MEAGSVEEVQLLMPSAPLAALEVLGIEYNSMNTILDRLRTDFPEVMTASEYTEATPDEDFQEEAPTAEEFVEQLQQEDHQDPGEAETIAVERSVSKDDFANAIGIVEKYRRMHEENFGVYVEHVYGLRKLWQRRQLELEISSKGTLQSIMECLSRRRRDDGDDGDACYGEDDNAGNVIVPE